MPTHFTAFLAQSVQTVGGAVPTHSAAFLAHCRCRRLAVQCQVGRQCQPIPPQSWHTAGADGWRCSARWAGSANPFRRNPGAQCRCRQLAAQCQPIPPHSWHTASAYGWRCSAMPGGHAVPTHSAAILAHCQCRQLRVQY